jgi:CheY-like chemotaxis protein
MLAPIHAILRCVNNGKEAINMSSDFDPDIVLMDIQMPEMDGVTASIELINRQFNKPIIVFTVNVMKGDIEHYIDKEINDYIPKPIDINLLYQIVAHYFQYE